MKKNLISSWIAYPFLGFCLLSGWVILIPVFRSAKSASKITTCLSNVKMQGLGVIQYAADNNDCLPNARMWMDQASLYKAEKKTFRCPLLSEGQYGYAFMDKLSKRNTEKIDNPAETLLIVEATDTRWNAHGDMSLLPEPPRYASRNFVGFADGRATGMNRFNMSRLPRQ